MTKEDFIEEKRERLREIENEQRKIIADTIRFTKRAGLSRRRSPFRKRSNAKRKQQEKIATVIQRFSQLRMLEAQKHIVLSQPFPKYPKGSPGSIGTNGPEIIINP